MAKEVIVKADKVRKRKLASRVVKISFEDSSVVVILSDAVAVVPSVEMTVT